MAYFLINYLCITGAIVGWIVYSSKGWRRKSEITGGYLIISVALFVLLHFEGPSLAGIVDVFLGLEKNDNVPTECRGAMDEADAGLRHIMVGTSNSFQAGVGKRLVLRGWIASIYSQKNPITVRLVPRTGGKSGASLTVVQENRPDVVKATSNPLLERCGFRAECLLPSDLRLGKYQVFVECRDSSGTEQFIPRCEVEVVSAQTGAALDAPIEQALKEQKAREAKAKATPKPSPHKKVRNKHKTQTDRSDSN